MYSCNRRLRKGTRCNHVSNQEKKIAHHIDSIPADRFTPFDQLLYDYLHDELNARLAQMHISKLKYHIDWLDDYKCIAVDSVCNQVFINIQIESAEFSIAYAADEPDDYAFHALIGKEQFYQTIEATVNEILK